MFAYVTRVCFLGALLGNETGHLGRCARMRASVTALGNKKIAAGTGVLLFSNTASRDYSRRGLCSYE